MVDRGSALAPALLAASARTVRVGRDARSTWPHGKRYGENWSG